jgi:hypothetical protein
MYDYMSALQQMFFHEPDCLNLRSEIDYLRQKVKQQLPTEMRREFLSLIDKESELCDSISVASFTAGFRLAIGIATELSLTSPFTSEYAAEQHPSEMLTQDH